MKHTPTKVSQPLSISTNCPQHKQPFRYPQAWVSHAFSQHRGYNQHSPHTAGQLKIPFHLQHFFLEVPRLTLSSPATNPNPSILAMKKWCFKTIIFFTNTLLQMLQHIVRDAKLPASHHVITELEIARERWPRNSQQSLQWPNVAHAGSYS